MMDAITRGKMLRMELTDAELTKLPAEAYVNHLEAERFLNTPIGKYRYAVQLPDNSCKGFQTLAKALDAVARVKGFCIVVEVDTRGQPCGHLEIGQCGPNGEEPDAC